MRTLILMRHGEAEAHADTGRDVDRSLTTQGEAQARGAGRALAAAGLRPDRALVSAARRTVETWELASAVLGGPDGETRIDLYDAPADDLLDAAHDCDAAVVAVVAHNPGAGELARRLSGSEGGFPPGALAVFAWPEPKGAPRLVLRRDPEAAGA